MEGTAVCPNCESEKPVSAFYEVKERRSGHSSWCRECTKGKARAKHIFATYGITEVEYELLLESQHGVCAACGKSETAKFRNSLAMLSVDHCHETGKARGLLCHRCNRVLGHIGEDPEVLRGLLRYIDSFQF